MNWIRTYNKSPMRSLELWEAADYVNYDRIYCEIIDRLTTNAALVPTLLESRLLNDGLCYGDCVYWFSMVWRFVESKGNC